jgi:PKD repeat protein
MKKTYKIWSYIIATLLISSMLVNVGIAAPQPPEPPPALPNVYVDPSSIVDPNIGPGETLTVYVRVTEVSQLYGWGFFLYYKPSVLSFVSLVKGDFVHPLWGFKKASGANYVTAAAYFTAGNPVGISGSGALAVVTFEVVGTGIALLDLTNTKLNTYVGGVVVPIEHTASDGIFDNRLENAAPTASFFATPAIGAEGDTVTFDATGSSDDGWLVNYQWDFGDRSTGSGDVVTHNYPRIGVYTVSLLVTDNEGAIGSAEYTLEILSWMDGGYFPDLTGERVWPEASVNPNEDKSFNEKQLGDRLTLWAKVGNPVDAAFDVVVEFQIYSDDGTFMGTVSSEVEQIAPYETKTIATYFYLAESRWRSYPYWRQKYYSTAFVYHNTSSGTMEKGRFPGSLWFRINAEDHDRAILGLTATSPVETGETAVIEVTLENQGWADETAIVTLTVDLLPVASQTVTIAVHEQKTITFYWDTTGYNPDSYYLEVKMAPHPFERDTTDNMVSTRVTVTA